MDRAQRKNIYDYDRLNPKPYEDEAIIIRANEQDQRLTRLPNIIPTLNDCVVDYQNCVGKSLLINSASRLNMGGGARNGAIAQEESLIYRSNLYEALVSTGMKCPLRRIKGIYTPNVLFFRDLHYSDIEPFNVDVLSIYSTPIGKLKPYEAYVLNMDIFGTIISICKEYDVKNLVMPPIGCGVFRHPIEKVMKCMIKTLQKYEHSIENVYVSCLNDVRKVNEIKKLL
ncbi:hypothetical protein GEMRC1_005071 [Eukaryota sp. GEM-RC1]